ncbi:hypothetical protein SLEP1_g9038 [Rubroshorea leprosula]|uniref:Uncharacterized protein n=1 Tax=Rubroshorea leprosula TaxID=152421 RepID=A0AAV5IDJ6_9ROSI|nr:hypothetical protein SLEP1_g9038 [Rubroshorea leprosula]
MIIIRGRTLGSNPSPVSNSKVVSAFFRFLVYVDAFTFLNLCLEDDAVMNIYSVYQRSSVMGNTSL